MEGGMNVQIRFFLVVAVLVGTLQGCQESAPDATVEKAVAEGAGVVPDGTIDLSGDRAERLLADFTETFEAVWAQGDAEGLAQLYAEDAVQVISSQQLPLYGRAEIQSGLAASFAGTAAGSRISTKTEVAKFLAADIVMGSGTYETKSPSGQILMSGLWSNAWRLENDGLKMLLESAGDYAVDGMDEASAKVSQVMDPQYTGAGADLLNAGVAAYVEHTNAGDLSGVADLFLTNGLQAVSRNGRIIQGRANILAAMSATPAESGTTLSAQGYGYRPIGGDLAIGWGAFQQTSNAGEIVEYGLWGNIWVVTDKGLMLISERAGSYSGG